MARAVFCFAKSELQAIDIVDGLKAAGFSSGDVSVLFPDKGATRDFAHEQKTKALEGGALGWLAGVGSLAVPGLGPFIAAGPIMGALSGAAAGAAVGGLAGALIGLGIPEHEAKLYEGKVAGGNILISVHTEDRAERQRAKEVFEEAGAEHVATKEEASVSA